MNHRFVRTLVVALGILTLCGMLGLYRPIAAAPKDEEERGPFANSVAQRAEMISLLKEVNAQLKQQNELLSSGKLTVVVSTEKSPGTK